MSKHALVALAFLFSASGWAQQAPPAADPANRPGGTTQIAPTPGPATAPALPSPSLPQATIQNRENARAAKAERKTKKKAAKKPSKTTKAAPSRNSTASKTPAGSSTTPPGR